MKDKVSESLLQGKAEKRCALSLLPRALDFVRVRDTEFLTSELQKILGAGYGQTVKVIDAMIALCIIEVASEGPRRYKRVFKTDHIDHDIYYNGGVYSADNESHTGWDPSLFKSKCECLAHLKTYYSGSFENTVYWVETIRVDNGIGWDIIDRKEIRADEI